MRPANVRKNEYFKEILGYFTIFCPKFDLEHVILNIFFSLFQCGPRDFSLSIMRPPSHFEFETPGLKACHSSTILLAMMQGHCDYFKPQAYLNLFPSILISAAKHLQNVEIVIE